MADLVNISRDGQTILASSGWMEPLRHSGDGGRTWDDVADSGFTMGSATFMKFIGYALSPDGRIGLAVAPTGSDAVDFGGVREPVARDAGIVFRSADGGLTWVEADGSARAPLENLAFLFNRIAITVGWNKFNITHYSDIAPKTDMLRSADAGLTWTRVAIPPTATPAILAFPTHTCKTNGCPNRPAPSSRPPA